jgi:hypothetical protein
MRMITAVPTRVVLGGAALAAALLASAPAGAPALAQQPAVTAAPEAPSSPEEVMALRRRAAGYWQAKFARDFATQYDYLEPRERGRTSPEELAQKSGTGLEVLGYQVEDAVIRESFATVQVRLLVRPNHPLLQGHRIGPQAMVIPDQWVRVGGTWYRVARPEAQSAGGGAPVAPRPQP